MAIEPMRINHLYISSGHSFFGHRNGSPGEHLMIERSEIQCLAGRGIEGDRFLDFKPGYKGQITFFALEIYEELCKTLLVNNKAPSVFRRNVIVFGSDLNALIGQEFEVQGVRFRGKAECSPCYWMDQAFAPRTEALLKGRGGLRAVILTDGALRTDLASTGANRELSWKDAGN